MRIELIEDESGSIHVVHRERGVTSASYVAPNRVSALAVVDAILQRQDPPRNYRSIKAH